MYSIFARIHWPNMRKLSGSSYEISFTRVASVFHFASDRVLGSGFMPVDGSRTPYPVDMKLLVPPIEKLLNRLLSIDGLTKFTLTSLRPIFQDVFEGLLFPVNDHDCLQGATEDEGEA